MQLQRIEQKSEIAPIGAVSLIMWHRNAQAIPCTHTPPPTPPHPTRPALDNKYKKAKINSCSDYILVLFCLLQVLDLDFA